MCTIVCQDCGHEAQDQNLHCPNCGATIRRRPARLILIGLIGSMVICVVLWIIQIMDGSSVLGPRKAAAAQAQPEKPAKTSTDQPSAPTQPHDNIPLATKAGTMERLAEEKMIELLSSSMVIANKSLVKNIAKSADKEAGPGRYVLTITYRESQSDKPSETVDNLLGHIRVLGDKLFSEAQLGQVTTFIFMPCASSATANGLGQDEPMGKIVLDRAIAEATDWQNIGNKELMNILQREESFGLHKSLK